MRLYKSSYDEKVQKMIFHAILLNLVFAFDVNRKMIFNDGLY